MKSLKYIIESILSDGDELDNRKFIKKAKCIDDVRQFIKQELDSKEYKEGDTIDLNNIDISEMLTVSHMFDITLCDANGKRLDYYDLRKYNYDVSEWNMSKTVSIDHLFTDCKYFNCDLSKWKLPKLTFAVGAFRGCENFEGTGLDKWKLPNLYSATGMFKDCTKFNADISNWGCAGLHYAKSMFMNCKKFKQNLSTWRWPSEKTNMFAGTPIAYNKKYKPHI